MFKDFGIEFLFVFYYCCGLVVFCMELGFFCLEQFDGVCIVYIIGIIFVFFFLCLVMVDYLYDDVCVVGVIVFFDVNDCCVFWGVEEVVVIFVCLVDVVDIVFVGCDEVECIWGMVIFVEICVFFLYCVLLVVKDGDIGVIVFDGDVDLVFVLVLVVEVVELVGVGDVFVFGFFVVIFDGVDLSDCFFVGYVVVEWVLMIVVDLLLFVFFGGFWLQVGVMLVLFIFFCFFWGLVFLFWCVFFVYGLGFLVVLMWWIGDVFVVVGWYVMVVDFCGYGDVLWFFDYIVVVYGFDFVMMVFEGGGVWDVVIGYFFGGVVGMVVVVFFFDWMCWFVLFDLVIYVDGRDVVIVCCSQECVFVDFCFEIVQQEYLYWYFQDQEFKVDVVWCVSVWVIEQISVQNYLWDVCVDVVWFIVLMYVIGVDFDVYSIFIGDFVDDVFVVNLWIIMLVVEGVGYFLYCDCLEEFICQFLEVLV